MCFLSYMEYFFLKKRHEGGLFGKGKGTDVSMVRSKYIIFMHANINDSYLV